MFRTLQNGYIWDKVFNKNGPSKICGRQPFKKLKGLWPALCRPYHFKFFKDCLPQILLCPFLNILTHMKNTEAELNISLLLNSKYFSLV